VAIRVRFPLAVKLKTQPKSRFSARGGSSFGGQCGNRGSIPLGGKNLGGQDVAIGVSAHLASRLSGSARERSETSGRFPLAVLKLSFQFLKYNL